MYYTVIVTRQNKANNFMNKIEIQEVSDLEKFIVNFETYLIPDFLKLGKFDYLDKLVNDFNGIKGESNTSYVYFENKYDAEKALEWVESVILINRIVNQSIK